MTHAQPQKKSLWNMNVDLMHGPILKSLLLFMLPILISNLFQQLYNTVDTMIVGNVLGDTALAAIGSCGSIYELLVAAVLWSTARFWLRRKCWREILRHSS